MSSPLVVYDHEDDVKRKVPLQETSSSEVEVVELGMEAGAEEEEQMPRPRPNGEPALAVFPPEDGGGGEINNIAASRDVMYSNVHIKGN